MYAKYFQSPREARDRKFYSRFKKKQDIIHIGRQATQPHVAVAPFVYKMNRLSWWPITDCVMLRSVRVVSGFRGSHSRYHINVIHIINNNRTTYIAKYFDFKQVRSKHVSTSGRMRFAIFSKNQPWRMWTKFLSCNFIV